MSDVYIAPPPEGIKPPEESGGWGLQWWYNAHFTYGAIQTVFIPILVPTYVKEMTGSATKVGIAMAIIGCGGLVAPVIGGVADKLRAHRWAQLAGLIAYAAAAIVFAFSGATFAMHILGAALFGVGSATLLMINPAFIVSGGFGLTQGMLMFAIATAYAVGSVAAGAAADSSLGYPCLAWMVAGVCVLAAVVGWLTFSSPKKADEAT